MLLLKTRFENLSGVLQHSKHATHYVPHAEAGDVVLLHITKNTLPRGQKSIQFVATFEDCYRDTVGESIQYWRHPWRYIIQLSNIREVDPFNLDDIQVSPHNYGPVITHCRLLAQDERAVSERIGS